MARRDFWLKTEGGLRRFRDGQTVFDAAPGPPSPSSWTNWVTATVDPEEGGPVAEPTIMLAASARYIAPWNLPNSNPGRRTSRLMLDSELADAVGRTRPLLRGSHTYSGASFPATFAASTINTDPADGWTHSCLNVKTPSSQWEANGEGSLDTHITNFVNSIPQGHTVYLIINHEPENDGPGTDQAWEASHGPHWRAAQRRYAKVIADLDDDRCHLAICHMQFTQMTPNRTMDGWNPALGGDMPQYVKERTIIGPDGYQQMTAGGGLNATPSARFVPFFDYYRGYGFSRFAVSENILNNNAGATASQVATQYTNAVATFIRNERLVYYALYEAQGPAAGTAAFLDAPEKLAAFGAICAEHRPVNP